MKKYLVLIAGILMAGTAMVPAAQAQQQPYIGAGIGAFTLNPGASNDAATGAYLTVGNNFMPYLGGEIRVGGTTSANNTAKLNWFVGVYAKPKYDVTPDLTLYGLLGITEMRTTYTSQTSNRSQGTTKTDFSFGLGADYWAANQYTIGIEWVRYESRADSVTKNYNFGGLNIDSYVLDAKYHF